MEFYTVDRFGTLYEGSECGLVKYSDINPPCLGIHVDELFPDGVSTHGERYFLRGDAHAQVVDPMLELLFDQVRRTAYLDRPSRFQSMFAVGSLAAAHQFQAQYGGGAIYRVSADVIFRGDMKLLNAGNSTLVTSWFAHQYWRGEAGSEEPFWEWLLKCPVKVGERVA